MHDCGGGGAGLGGDHLLESGPMWPIPGGVAAGAWSAIGYFLGLALAPKATYHM